MTGTSKRAVSTRLHYLISSNTDITEHHVVHSEQGKDVFFSLGNLQNQDNFQFACVTNKNMAR